MFFSSSILKDCIEVQKKEKKIVVLCSRPPWNVKLGSFTSYSCSDAKEMYKKKCNARAEFSAVLKLVLFCGSRYRRRPRRHCSRSLFGLWGWRKKMWVGRIQSTLSKSDTFGAGTKCPSKRDARLIRESNKGSKERQGPTLVVHFTEVSPSYRGVR